MEEPMSQTQAIFAHAATPKYGVGETIGNAVSQAAEWLGRTVTYIANVVAEYAVKAWEYGVVFFGMAMDFVKENQEAFSYVGAAATVGAIGYVIAKILGVGSKEAAKTPATAKV
jgi:hypothetical protein